MRALSRKGLLKIYVGCGDYERAAEASREALAYYRLHQDEDMGDYVTVLLSTARRHLMKDHQDLPQTQA